MMQPISAPIPVPGSQQEPTTPSLGSTNGRIASLGSGTLGLRRFPSLGNAKKLSVENTTMRAKIAELERYLTGLKEELILAHRHIQTKNLEAKISQERKGVEIHELGQHIQRCEFDLLAKTAECEALQNKLQYQTKEQMTKLRHINLLENEIMDYRRMSIMSGNGGGNGGNTASSGTTLSSSNLRNSRNSTELTESVRSSTVLQEANAQQMKDLKDENARKEEQIQSLTEKLERLQADLARTEQQRARESAIAAAAAPVTTAPTATANSSDKIKFDTANVPCVSCSTSSESFNTASAYGFMGGTNSISTITCGYPSSSSVNSVGYDVATEHPKLIARYQALSMQHAQASEYVDSLETENRDLKVQLLAPSDSTSTTETAANLNAMNGLNHPAASGLTPLDTDLSNQHYQDQQQQQQTDESTFLNSPSPPTSATTAGSPSTVVAPVLTQKSSLRYSRDGQVSPTATVTAITQATATA
ncbi:hypothetical protein BGZ83_000453 [Gryganskiella cystojenkinii]|nr:hypothetical protein BGZ83_000453 [Gryganskiella cystojenkinii]